MTAIMEFSFACWLGLSLVLLVVLLRLLQNSVGSILHRWIDGWVVRWRPCKLFRVPEFYGSDGFQQQNDLYRKVSMYVGTLGDTTETPYVNLISPEMSKEILVSLEAGQSVEDVFLGVRLRWIHEVAEMDGKSMRSFVLKVGKKDKVGLLRPYLEHIEAVADDAEQRWRQLKLFVNDFCDNFSRERWASVPFTHPATFESLALDSELKSGIKADIDAFLKGRNYYHRVGKPWKRGYLFHGPAGTGKSSMIAAIAAYLHYDVYDLDLSKIRDCSDLRMALMQTHRRSVMVVQDIDCSVEFVSKSGGSVDGEELGSDGTGDICRVSVSALLNFMEGLWSCCGEERILIFTANSKEKLDQSLFRAGRIDTQFFFPPCNFSAFKAMAHNYLSLRDHKHFTLVEEAFRAPGVCMTPAEVADVLWSHKGSPSRALRALVSALHQSAGRDVQSPVGSPQTPHHSNNHQETESKVSSKGMLQGRGGKSQAITVKRSRGNPENSVIDMNQMRKLQNLFRLNNRKSKKAWGFQMVDDDC